MDLVKDKSKEEIADIWRQYHADKDCVSAVIPAEMYARMKERFQKYKTFLFPLPRKQGYEFIVVQFEGNEAHFATLINYQAYGANAPECLTLVHYPELADEKGIVLMVGEYDTNMLVSECVYSFSTTRSSAIRIYPSEMSEKGYFQFYWDSVFFARQKDSS